MEKSVNSKGIIALHAQMEQVRRLIIEWNKHNGDGIDNSYGIIGKIFEPIVTVELRNWVKVNEIARASKQGENDAFFTKKGERFTVQVKSSLLATYAQDNRWTGRDADESLRDLLNNDFLVFDTKNITVGYDYATAVDRLLIDPLDYDFSTVRVARCAEFVKALLDNDLIHYTVTKRGCLYKGRNVYGKNYKGENAILSHDRYNLLWELINEKSIPWDEFKKWRWSRK